MAEAAPASPSQRDRTACYGNERQLGSVQLSVAASSQRVRMGVKWV
jgi:hypothetical protein